MTLEKALRLAELMEPGHVVDEELLIEFLNELEGKIQMEIFLVAPEEVIVYTAQDKQKELLLRPPHDRVYVHYLAGMIRMVNREFEDYNNQCALVDEKLREFRTWFKQTYRPADTHCRDYINQTPGTVRTAWRGYYLTAYGIAVKHGFRGTEAEWLGSLQGEKGEKGEPALMRYDPETGLIQWQSRGDESWQDLFPVDAIADGIATTEYVDRIAEQIRADLMYRPIEISGIRHEAGVQEMGASVKALTVSWELSKAPYLQTLDGMIVAPEERSVVLSRIITETTAFTLRVEDERGATDEAGTTVYFYNGVYFGALYSDMDAVDSAAILSLERKLQGGRSVDFTVTPGVGKRPVYACPSRYGTPLFRIRGFEYSWDKIGTIRFVNGSGYAEDYDVWMHPQNVFGNVTVTVR